VKNHQSKRLKNLYSQENQLQKIKIIMKIQ